MSQRLKPLPIGSIHGDYDGALLPDGTNLRLRQYSAWPRYDDRVNLCERATWVLERVSANEDILWSITIVIDAPKGWDETCAGYGTTFLNKWDEEANRRRVSHTFDDSIYLAVYLLDDNTFLLPTATHLLRLRLSDGHSERLGARAALISSDEIKSFKRTFISEWPKRQKIAAARLMSCLGGPNYPIGDWQRLVQGKCRSEFEDPYEESGYWYPALNFEIRQTYINRRSN